ncbi:hypothetical protein BV20DRAFT_609621 [Pilatotrama ljubarskyi]|nr:hypothetical protein BV20DRAFT_609621 [Pilatotrama ljubarskyi]
MRIRALCGCGDRLSPVHCPLPVCDDRTPFYLVSTSQGSSTPDVRVSTNEEQSPRQTITWVVGTCPHPLVLSLSRALPYVIIVSLSSSDGGLATILRTLYLNAIVTLRSQSRSLQYFLRCKEKYGARRETYCSIQRDGNTPALWRPGPEVVSAQKWGCPGRSLCAAVMDPILDTTWHSYCAQDGDTWDETGSSR